MRTIYDGMVQANMENRRRAESDREHALRQQAMQMDQQRMRMAQAQQQAALAADQRRMAAQEREWAAAREDRFAALEANREAARAEAQARAQESERAFQRTLVVDAMKTRNSIALEEAKRKMGEEDRQWERAAAEVDITGKKLANEKAAGDLVIQRRDLAILGGAPAAGVAAPQGAAPAMPTSFGGIPTPAAPQDYVRVRPQATQQQAQPVQPLPPADEFGLAMNRAKQLSSISDPALKAAAKTQIDELKRSFGHVVQIRGAVPALGGQGMQIVGDTLDGAVSGTYQFSIPKVIGTSNTFDYTTGTSPKIDPAAAAAGYAKWNTIFNDAGGTVSRLQTMGFSPTDITTMLEVGLANGGGFPEGSPQAAAARALADKLPLLRDATPGGADEASKAAKEAFGKAAVEAGLVEEFDGNTGKFLADVVRQQAAAMSAQKVFGTDHTESPTFDSLFQIDAKNPDPNIAKLGATYGQAFRVLSAKPGEVLAAGGVPPLLASQIQQILPIAKAAFEARANAYGISLQDAAKHDPVGRNILANMALFSNPGLAQDMATAVNPSAKPADRVTSALKLVGDELASPLAAVALEEAVAPLANPSTSNNDQWVAWRESVRALQATAKSGGYAGAVADAVLTKERNNIIGKVTHFVDTNEGNIADLHAQAVWHGIDLSKLFDAMHSRNAMLRVSTGGEQRRWSSFQDFVDKPGLVDGAVRSPKDPRHFEAPLHQAVGNAAESLIGKGWLWGEYGSWGNQPR